MRFCRPESRGSRSEKHTALRKMIFLTIFLKNRIFVASISLLCDVFMFLLTLRCGTLVDSDKGLFPLDFSSGDGDLFSVETGEDFS